MERLPKRLSSGAADYAVNMANLTHQEKSIYRQKCVEALAAYEDTGLEPEDVLSAAHMVKIGCALHELNAYKGIGTICEFRALKDAEQQRREGCIRCERESCDTCYRFGWHPDICEKCENQSQYSPKPFCSRCGRDLRGES